MRKQTDEPQTQMIGGKPATYHELMAQTTFLALWPDRDEPGVRVATHIHTGKLLTREQFARLLAAATRWYDTHTDEDIQAWNDAVDQDHADQISVRDREPRARRRRARTRPGVVYLVRSGEHYRIGCTKELLVRSRTLGIELPLGIEIIHTIASDDIEEHEAYWHERFAAKRLNGEWFALTAADVAEFCGKGGH